MSDVVRIVNEMFHDHDAANYDAKHSEILVQEVTRWKKLLRLSLRGKKPGRLILDTGSGTGFVPAQLLSHLTSEDELICTDISAGMLNAAKRRIESMSPRCRVRYLKLDSSSFPVEDSSVDLITANSVVHHMANPEGYADEVLRMLKPAGKWVVAHEPNIRFFSHRFLMNNERRWRKWAQFFTYHMESGRLKWLSGRRRNPEESPTAEQQALIEERINARLHAAGLLSETLSYRQIEQLVDYHSPSAGRSLRQGVGLTPEMLAVSGLAIVWKETYNHLYKMSDAGAISRLYSAVLKTLYSGSGSQFAAIYQKEQ